MTDQTWRRDAACLGLDTDLFFPSSDGGDWSAPKRICGNCPVKEQCLAESLRVSKADQYGIWGGLGPRARIKVKRHQDYVERKARK